MAARERERGAREKQKGVDPYAGTTTFWKGVTSYFKNREVCNIENYFWKKSADPSRRGLRINILCKSQTWAKFAKSQIHTNPKSLSLNPKSKIQTAPIWAAKEKYGDVTRLAQSKIHPPLNFHRGGCHLQGNGLRRRIYHMVDSRYKMDAAWKLDTLRNGIKKNAELKWLQNGRSCMC